MLHPRSRAASLCFLAALLSFACCLVASAPAQPADCLVYGELRDIHTLCTRGGEILGRLDGQTTPVALLAHIGDRIQSPSLAGVDLTSPAHFWMLDPRKYSDPWVYALRPKDHTAFEAGINGWYAESEADARKPGHHPRPPLTTARMLGYQIHIADRLLLCRDTQAGAAVAHWLQAESMRAKPELQLRCVGQITLRIQVQRILSLYEKEYAEEVEQMKSRMREAIERLGHRPDAEAGIVAAQSELDRFAKLARDVSNIDIAFRMEPESASLSLNIQSIEGSLLDRAIRAHPRGGTALLGVCPSDAMLVLYSNLSAAEAVGNMILRTVGSSALDALRHAVAPESSMMLAVMMTPEPNRVVRVLEVRDGVTAATTWSRWDRFAVAEGAQAPVGVPFILRRLPTPADAPAETRLAAIHLDEKALGVAASRAIGRLFGAAPLVAQRFADGRSVAAVALDPMVLLKQTTELAALPHLALSADVSLRQTLAGLPTSPNILFYAAPSAVRGWLGLGGFKCGPPRPEELGFAATLSLTEQGRIIGVVRVPTAALREALTDRK